jgi:hypothetical protein
MANINDMIDDDNNLDYAHPYLVLSDDNNICKTWQTALNDSNFKDDYNSFNDIERSNIDNNLENRTCQSIKGTKKCFTVNGVLETCNNLQNQIPKTIKPIMTRLDNEINDKKKIDVNNLNKFIKEKDTLLTNLINQYTSRKDLLNTNESYHSTIDLEINKKEKDEVELGDKIDKIDNLKEFTIEDIKDERSKFFWYQTYNKIINMILKGLLSIYILIIIMFLLHKKNVF